MYKLWISLLAMTVFAALTVNGLRAFEEQWRNKCKDVGVEYNSAKYYRRYREYIKCGATSLNITQYMEDTYAMMRKFKSAELDFSTIKPTLQKYCPQAKSYLNCEKKLSTECFSEEENLRWTIHGSIRKSFIDFFCENDASRMTEFINGNGIECGMSKEHELRLCFDQYNEDLMSAALLSATMGDKFTLFAILPKTEILCNCLETIGNCLKQLFQQCDLSEAPAKQIADLFSYIETETKCATMPKIYREGELDKLMWTLIQSDNAGLRNE